jgi:DNA repair exonuclease SbcCD ATPase subunit
MLRFNYIEIENYVHYKKARLSFKKGVTFVLGKNLNRRVAGASNAAGKSVLTGALTTLVQDTHTVVTKGGKSAGKSLYKKNTKVTTSFNIGKNAYTFSRVGSKLSITANGKDLDSRVARKSLDNLLPWTTEEWLTTIHVDGRRTNNFLLGTSSDRQAFITRLFRLDSMDELRKRFGRNITELKSKKYDLDHLKSLIKQHEDFIKKQPENLDERVEALTENLNILQKNRRSLQRMIHLSTIRSEYLKTLEKIKALPKTKLTFKEATSLLDSLLKYEGEVVQYKKRVNQAKKVKEEIEALRESVGDKVAYLEKAVALKKKLTENRVREPKTVKKPERKAVKVDKKKLEKLVAEYSSSKEFLESLLEICDSHECPTCKQPLDKPKATVSRLQKLVKTLKTEITDLQENVKLEEQWVLYKEFVELRGEYELWFEKYKKVEAFPFDDIERLLALEETEVSINKPKKPTSIEKEELRSILEIHSKRKHLQETLEQYEKQLPGSQTLDMDTLKIQINQVDEKIQKITKVLPKLEAIKTLVANAKSEIEESRKKAIVLKKEVRDLPVYELLQRAYSNKGIKQLIIASLCKTLEKNLNKFAKFTFEEGFQFKIVIEANNFDIMVIRKTGEACDIRNFSGAESRLFALVFLLALLPMIPASRRCNLLILDEPTANMDTPLLEKFRDVLVPLLSKIVPSILIVSPNHEIVPQQARVLTVVKKGNVATLEETNT